MSVSKVVVVTLLGFHIAATLPVKAACADSGKKDSVKLPADGDKKAQASKDQVPSPTGTMVSTSRIVIISPPTSIFTDGDSKTRTSKFVIRATVANLCGPILLGGELEDKDSHRKLPIDAFELMTISKDADGTEKYLPVTTTSSLPDAAITPTQLLLKADWVVAGNYTGILRIAAIGDTAGQDVKLDVSVRPCSAWWFGVLFLSIGAGLSWFAVTYAARQRQMAGNEILVARLAEVVKKLKEELKSVGAAGAQQPKRTLAHIDQILADKLRQLLTDKEVSVVAGVTVPSIGAVTVLDEVEGVNHIVQHGFTALLDMWNLPTSNHEALAPFFSEMDGVGSVPRPLTEIDQKIKDILSAAGPVATGKKDIVQIAELPALPSENAVVHRVVFTTFLLDAVAFLTVVALGAYILIWKNTGFGSVGNLFEAFFWGLGLKLGTDAARLGPSDVRTAYAIKIPAAP